VNERTAYATYATLFFPQKKAPLSFVTSLIGLSVIWQQDPLITVVGSFPFCRAMPACAQRGPCCLSVRSRCGNVLNQRNKYPIVNILFLFLILPTKTDRQNVYCSRGPAICLRQLVFLLFSSPVHCRD